MTQFESDQQPNVMKSDTALTQHEFDGLDLKALGLQPEDFIHVQDAHRELADLNHATVAEYGKDIASVTSAYTDELLHLVRSKDLDETGKKLNEVVHVAKQLNTSSILNKPKTSTIPLIGGLLNRMKGAKQSFDQNFVNTKEQIDGLVKEIETTQIGLKLESIPSIKCLQLYKMNTNNSGFWLQQEKSSSNNYKHKFSN